MGYFENTLIGTNYKKITTTKLEIMDKVSKKLEEIEVEIDQIENQINKITNEGFLMNVAETKLEEIKNLQNEIKSLKSKKEKLLSKTNILEKEYFAVTDSYTHNNKPFVPNSMIFFLKYFRSL